MFHYIFVIVFDTFIIYFAIAVYCAVTTLLIRRRFYAAECARRRR
jgi:hypothetical protein